MKVELSAEELLIATKACMELKHKYEDDDQDEFKIKKVRDLQHKLWKSFNRAKRQAVA